MDSAVIVFNYIATVGTVNKKIVDKCLTVFKTHLPSLSLNEAPKILKSLVEIFVKIGSNLKKEVRKELLI